MSETDSPLVYRNNSHDYVPVTQEAKKRRQWRRVFYQTISKGTAEEALTILIDCARRKQPWAVKELLNRIFGAVKQEVKVEGVDQQTILQMLIAPEVPKTLDIKDPELV